MEKKMQGEKKSEERASSPSISSIFAHADAVDKWLMFFGTFGAVADGLSTPITYYVTSKVMNDIGGFSNSSGLTETINEKAVTLLYISIGMLVSAFLEGYCWTRTAERQASRMRARYLKAVLRQDVAYYDLKVASTTEVITSISSDSLVIQDAISEKVPNFMMSCTNLVGGYTVGFLMLWRLALVAFPTVLLLIIPGILYGRILMGLALKIREEYNKAGHVAEQAIASVRTVYSFVGEAKTMTEFSSSLNSSFQLGIRQGLIKGISLGSNSIIFSIWALIVWYGSRLVMEQGALGGTVFSVGSVIITSGIVFGTGLSNMKYIAEASVAAERILNVVKKVPKIDSESMEGEVLENVLGEVEFKAVEFAYPSRPESIILNNFNLKVPAGKAIALVGSSGSGKSTVIALLERFYDPIRGEVLLDGVDIRKLRVKWLRSQMGLVSQEPALFATSIKENILFGREDASMEEVMDAAKAANIHDFISQLPQGYGTQVGERGIQLSGGQKQRVAIARAVLRSPKILLLDEATSALDSESERVVQEALDAASVGRTTIIVAHRLSTIRNSDVIMVVQSGQVVESGTHDELMQDEAGMYSPLVKLQQTPVRIRDAEIEAIPAPAKDLASSSSKRPNNGSINRLLSSLSRKSSKSFVMLDDEEDAEAAAAAPTPSFWRLVHLNASEWKQATMGSLCAAMAGAVQPFYAFAMGSMIAAFFQKDKDEIKAKTRTHCIIFVSLSFVSFIINVVLYYNLGAMGEHLTKRVREMVLSKILTFEVGWFDDDENSTGSICARLAKDATVVRSLVGDRMALLVQTVSAITIAYTLALITSWRLATVMIAMQPLIIFCFYARNSVLKKVSKQSINAQAESSKLAVEAVSNIRTITIFSSQERMLRLFTLSQESSRREGMKQSSYAGIGLGASHCLMRCTWALAFWYSGRLLSNGQATSKSLFQAFMIIISTGRIIADMGTTSTDLTKGTNAVASIFAILDRYTNIDSDDQYGRLPDTLAGSVEFRGVDFVYPTRPDLMIFNNLSLSVKAGESVALVGPSGSGKSSIIGLIERFYDPTRGRVMIDGKDLKSYHLRTLRRHIALVSQEPVLFAGTIRENIAYGVEEATEAEIEAAAKIANAHEFISYLKDGYDTWCGDRGLQLSGGQKQRIAIARAVLKDPAILLLDEATSALDSWSERVVQETLESVMMGRTSVVVAHRLSTVQNCDLIVVLDRGAVVEKGTHDALLEKGSSGVYYALVNLQQGALSPQL